ncbi:MAG: AraC family transcriptional regulator [Firmicutes bacterium]|nr:AraC family transcriptional regulator [Bacillota bacterium]
MEYISRIQSSIDYIEDNLTSDINFEDVAAKSFFSLYYFHKVFRAITQTSIKEYIRKRRLTVAAYELINTKGRIIDIAIKYQYQSQEAFTRAFKRMYGNTPGKYRKKKEHYVLLEKKRLTKDSLKHLNNGISLEPKIITKKRFKVIGMRYYGSNENSEIPCLWTEFYKRIGEIKERNANRALGVCEHVSNLSNLSKFRYIACVEVNSLGSIPEKMVSHIVPTNQYVVFTHKGPASKLDKTYRYIHGIWFPKSNYEPINADDFELYDQRFNNDKDSEMEIYIPIKRVK